MIMMLAMLAVWSVVGNNFLLFDALQFAVKIFHKILDQSQSVCHQIGKHPEQKLPIMLPHRCWVQEEWWGEICQWYSTSDNWHLLSMPCWEWEKLKLQWQLVTSRRNIQYSRYTQTVALTLLLLMSGSQLSAGGVAWKSTTSDMTTLSAAHYCEI